MSSRGKKNQEHLNQPDPKIRLNYKGIICCILVLLVAIGIGSSISSSSSATSDETATIASTTVKKKKPKGKTTTTTTKKSGNKTTTKATTTTKKSGNKTTTKASTTKPATTKVTTTKAPVPEVPPKYTWDGPKLTKRLGTVQGPSGKETFYNLNMSGVVRIMRNKGYSADLWPYWVRRSDGCKMLGNYIIVAANLELRPRGTKVKTSLGWGIVCDTGTFARTNRRQLDLAVNWVV